MAELAERVSPTEEHHTNHTNGADAEDRTASVEDTRASISSAEEFSRPPQPVSDSSPDPAMAKAVENVLLSDIGVNTLLGRLKQSVATAKDLASFLKKRSAMEDTHSKEMHRLCRLTAEALGARDARPASFAYQFEEVIQMHERIAENELSFGLNLHQMSVDLDTLSHEMERGRKQWKGTGLTAEQRVQEAEKALDKAKQKYDNLAEDYDHAKTGDKVSGRGFSFRPKSGATLEEDLLRKLNLADQDYQGKVQQAQALRQDLVTSARPQAVQALLQLIKECDSGVTLQLQKFASFNEKLLLGNGLLISPLNEQGNQRRSLRDVIGNIDNNQDFTSYVMGYMEHVPPRRENKYIRHPTLVPVPSSRQIVHQQREPSPPPAHISAPVALQSSGPISTPMHLHNPSSRDVQQPPSQFPMGSQAPVVPQHHELEAKPSQPEPPYPSNDGPPQTSPGHGYPHPSTPIFGSGGGGYGAQGGQPGVARPGSRGPQYATPHARPFFGVYLYDIFVRDQTPVPIVVQECIKAVETFGLDLEGIYRVSGNNTQVAQLRAQFENDPQSVDFRIPDAFFHDVNNAAALLKQFLRELPDPLLTTESYRDFLDAAAVTDDVQRRDKLHATINSLPDPNYATLRSLTLHLHKVIEHSDKNRMNANNLAVIFSPTLMGPHSGPVQEPALQYRAIETILINATEIFDDD